MDAEKEQLESKGANEEQNESSPKHQKSRSGPEYLDLSRCAGCYNHKASSMLRWGDDGESSSSAEDSGPEVDCESESSSSSSSSDDCSEWVVAEILEKPPPVSGDAAEDESVGKDGDRVEGTEENQEDKKRIMNRRASFVKSASLPASLTPRLLPLPFLPRPRTVVSTLRLQVSHNYDDDDSFCIVKQPPPKREEGEERAGRGGQEGVNSVKPPQPFHWQQAGLPWQQWSQPTVQQHRLSYQQPQHFAPLSAQCQRLPPSPHTLPVPYPPTLPNTLRPTPNAPHTHLHGPAAQPCWYCHSTYFPCTYWSK